MSLKARINDEMKEAMKAKDERRLLTLRNIRAEILKKETDGTKSEATDEQVLAIINSLVKQRRDSIDQFTSAGREDLAAKEREELTVLQTFLPAALSDEELAAHVDAVVTQTGAAGPKEMGKVMGPLMKRLKETGKSVDGQKVNALVKARLGG